MTTIRERLYNEFYGSLANDATLARLNYVRRELVRESSTCYDLCGGDMQSVMEIYIGIALVDELLRQF